MKTINDIEKEYNLFTTRDNVESLEDLKEYIKLAYNNIIINTKLIEDEISYNKTSKLLSNIKKMFMLFYRVEKVDLYKEDNKLLKELLIINRIYTVYIQMIESVSNECNYEEAFKLLDFLTVYYASNSNYVENKRDELDCIYKDEVYYGNKGEDTILIVDEFFHKEIRRISNINMEKIKKI